MTEAFCRTPLALLDDPRLDPYDTRIYETLWRRSDFHTHRTQPGTSVAVIVAISHVCKPTVLDSLHKLETTGWIVVEKGRRNQAPIYILQSVSLTTEPPACGQSHLPVAVNGTDHTWSMGLTTRGKRDLPLAVNGTDHRMGTAPLPALGSDEPFRSSPESTSERVPEILSETKEPPRAAPGPPSGAMNAAWEYYRQHIQPRARLTEGAKRKITLRLKTWTLEELHEAVDHFAADAWWMENNAHRGAEWFFATDGRIEQLRLLQPEARRNGNSQPKLYVNGSPLARRQMNHEEGRANAARNSRTGISDADLINHPELARLGVGSE